MGVVLALSHIISYLYWNFHILHFQSQKILWPFSFWKGVSQYQTELEALWIILAFLTIAAFTFIPHAVVGWILLTLTFLFKESLYFTDLSYSENSQYILTLLHIIYLFLPNKRTTIKFFIPLIFLNQALLKWNPQWLSGEFFMETLSLPQNISHPLSVLILVLESLVPWGLLLRSRKLFVIALLTTASILFLSPYTEFYIIITLLILTYYLFDRMETASSQSISFKKYFGPVPHPTWTLLHLGLYVTLQLIPWVVYKNPTGKFNGFLFALEPGSIEEEQDCTSTLVASHASKHQVISLFETPRHTCEIYKIYQLAKKQCLNEETQLFLNVQKQAPASPILVLVNESHFCDPQITFSIWAPNSWQINQEVSSSQIPIKPWQKAEVKESSTEEVKVQPRYSLQTDKNLNLNSTQNTVLFPSSEINSATLFLDKRDPATLHSTSGWAFKTLSPIEGAHLVQNKDYVFFQNKSHFYILDLIDGSPVFIDPLPPHSQKIFSHGAFYTFSYSSNNDPQSPPNLTHITKQDLDGKKLWTTQLENSRSPQHHLYIDPSFVIIETAKPSLEILKNQDGQRDQEITLESPLSTDVLRENSFLYYSLNNSKLYSYHLEKKEEIWNTELKTPAQLRPVVFPEQNRIVVLTQSDYLQIFNLRTGESQWRIRTFNENSISWLEPVRLSNALIQKYELPWRYKGYVAAALCGSSKICFFDPNGEKVVHRWSFGASQLLSPPQLFENQWQLFVLPKKKADSPSTGPEEGQDSSNGPHLWLYSTPEKES